MITIIHTRDELHELLDSLTHGQTVTATWKRGAYSHTSTGPVSINGKYITVYYHIRNVAGCISPDVTSIEATVTQATTVTRDDPDALKALIESLADGQRVTAEWRSEDGERVTIVTGPVSRDFAYECINVRDMWGEDCTLLGRGGLRTGLHSVTTTVAKTIRWEREA